ncbi:MAG: HEAT repeat domain-containing protein [Bryobacteraceae bacterium]|nr:HEAT repeat domain-containing protein [Bryobacteraceae bacterium]
MAARKIVDRKIEEVTSLRAESKSPALLDKLRRALADRNNLVVSKAAGIAGDLVCPELIPEMTAAFHRYLEDAEKTDPQCWAKNALARALRDLGYDEPELYLAGAKHIQMEPVWGGSQDTAAELRAICANALVACRSLRDMEVLRVLVDLMADREKTVRAAAAQAMGQIQRDESALLLRLKILSGDREAEVTGECFSAILRIEPRESIALIGRFLNSEDRDLPFEAVAALGDSHEPEALDLLKRTYHSSPFRDLRRAALMSMGATRQPAAIDFLIERITARESAEEAIAALATLRSNDEVRARVEKAVGSTGSDILGSAFRKEFRLA